MASGGRKSYSLSKLPASDTRQAQDWSKLTTNADEQNNSEPQIFSSQKNVHKEVRINNWDSADWRPNSARADAKRRKKSKGNPEREREQSLSLDSPPQRDKKPRTPSTFPRTKFGPSTPTSQKRALENLRSRITFSETDEPTHNEELESIEQLVDNLKERERAYKNLLQKTLASREALETGLVNGLASNDEEDDDHDEKGAESDDSPSVDLEIETNMSETTEERTHSSSSARPYIEDKLGETDEETDMLNRPASKEFVTMDSTLVAQRNAQISDWDLIDDQENTLVNALNAKKANELAALQQQQNLLKILAEKQEQLRALQGRQEALMAMHQEAEKKLIAAQNKENKAKAAAKSAAENIERATNPNLSQSESEDPIPSATKAQLEQLIMMKKRLEMLKNAAGEMDSSPEFGASENQAMAEEPPEHQQLQDKLEDLQDKKQRMDELLMELQSLRSQRYEALLEAERDEEGASAGVEPLMNTLAPQDKIKQAKVALDQADSTAESAEQALNMMDAQAKLQKLQEVKSRLDQLRGLVQYYRGVQDREDMREGMDQSSLPGYSDYGDIESLDNSQRPSADLKMVGASGAQAVPLNALGSGSSARTNSSHIQQSDEENASINESQMSSLGPWGDDPEIMEKVRLLKASKEKLQQLQNLVNMVQQTPEMAHSLPGNISEIGDSVEDEAHNRQDASRASQDRNISGNEREVPTRDQDRDTKEMSSGPESLLAVQEQIQELTELKKERERLLALQNQLKSLHDHFGDENEESESDERNDTENKKRPQSEPGPVVTFASNDELYSKMRKQRMLREELRSKKKELEAIMKKDRNKRQYFKNQDNQSDTVSYSTDAFGAGASADATMATWGGSTIDNLENITEDRNGNDEDDDGYPEDGIIQVEEEEENNSDNTYTIEADARQRMAAREKSVLKPDVRPKTRKVASFPRVVAESSPVVNRSMKKGKGGNKRTKQENYRSAEEIVRDVEDVNESKLDTIQKQVQQTLQLLQENHGQPAQAPLVSPNASGMSNTTRQGEGFYPDMLQQQMYQQQMMMSINQCYQQLNLQQMEMQNLHHHIQQLTLHMDGAHHPMNSSANDQETPRFTPIASSSAFPISPALNVHTTARQSTFSLNPQFPASFAHVDGTRAKQQHRTGLSPSGRQSQPTHTNNMPPAPPPRVDSYPQNSNLNNFMELTNDRDVRPKVNDFSKSRNNKKSQSQKYAEARDREEMENNNRFKPTVNSGNFVDGFGDTNSVTSALSARLGKPQSSDRDVSELSLFETLRETIYSEVATLISQNESRPHFLIELFRELQLLSTDYLRQRGIYAIQELVSKTLTAEENSFGIPQLAQKKKAPVFKYSRSVENNEYDYTEEADNTSTMSTPSTDLGESPFANDSLGDTVIHLDKLRAKEQDGHLDEQTLQVLYEKVREHASKKSERSGQTRHAEKAGEASSSDMIYSRISGSQLDSQVIQIINETVPVIKEHIDDVFSPQLLAYIKRLVLSLTRQNDSQQEFTSFFHRQLGSIFHDCLARFEGRKVRECGDDLLDSMSDALYNELAFFRMMQDLNSPSMSSKVHSNSSSKTSSPKKSPAHRNIQKKMDTDDADDSSEDEQMKREDTSIGVAPAEEEDLGKERDDELASEMPIKDADEKDVDPESPFKSSGLKIELAVSETKPFTRIGSDEDDEGSDESHSAEDPSETAVSRDAKMSENGAEVSETSPRNLGDGAEDGTVRSDRPNPMEDFLMVNGATEGGEVTVDDLPAVLNIPCSVDVAKIMSEEQNQINGTTAVLSSMDTPEELAGDGEALKEHHS